MPEDEKDEVDEVEDDAENGEAGAAAKKKNKKKNKKKKAAAAEDGGEGDGAEAGGAEEADGAAAAEEDGADDADGAAEGGERTAAQKKRDKKKAADARKKAAAAEEAAAGGDGAASVEAAADAGEWETDLRGIGRWSTAYPPCEKGGKQQTPGEPMVPVLEQFPSGSAPVGEEVAYIYDANNARKRISAAELRDRERLNSISYDEVRVAAECHRQVRKHMQSVIKPGILMTDMCEQLENLNRKLVQVRRWPRRL